jgi:hypothetical protein
VEILDSRGKLITKFSKLGPENSRLDISTLSKGVYYLRVRDDMGNTRTLKFIKK